MRTMIAIPCMDMVHTDFCRCLVGLEKPEGTETVFCQSSLIYDARNTLAEMAIERGFDRVLWLDSDVTFDPDLIRRLGEHLDLGKDFVTGLYFSRRAPSHPVIYSSLYLAREAGKQRAVADHFDDYPRDDIFKVAGCGFGAVMMTVPMLRRVQEASALPFFPATGFGEDLSFCLRATALGFKIWCDSSIKLGHVGASIFDEALYRSRKEEQA